MQTPSYIYKLRPAYQTNQLLIEFSEGVDNSGFVNDLRFALREIELELIQVEDVWMNDELLYSFNSNHGKFTLSIDRWDYAVILADENPQVVLKIDSILVQNSKFKKIKVIFGENENTEMK